MKNNRTEQLTPCGVACAATNAEPAAAQAAPEAVNENRARIACFTTIEIKLKKYRGDYKTIYNTIDELGARGVGKGFYQNYEALIDVLEILTSFKNALKVAEQTEPVNG